MNFKNFILALVTSSIWGSSFLMIKYSLEELNPSDIAIYRILIGALFINIFVRAKENIIKTDNVKIFIISFFWMALPFYMFGIAEQTITSSLAISDGLSSSKEYLIIKKDDPHIEDVTSASIKFLKFTGFEA